MVDALARGFPFSKDFISILSTSRLSSTACSKAFINSPQKNETEIRKTMQMATEHFFNYISPPILIFFGEFKSFSFFTIYFDNVWNNNKPYIIKENIRLKG